MVDAMREIETFCDDEKFPGTLIRDTLIVVVMLVCTLKMLADHVFGEAVFSEGLSTNRAGVGTWKEGSAPHSCLGFADAKRPQAPSIPSFHKPIPNKNTTCCIIIPAVHHAKARGIMPK